MAGVFSFRKGATGASEELLGDGRVCHEAVEREVLGGEAGRASCKDPWKS